MMKQRKGLMTQSLQSKASGTLVDIARLARGLTCVFKAKPGKLDIKRRKPGILLIGLPS